MALIEVDTSALNASHPLEMLLISSSSPDPHSTIIIDPKTGVSSWSYKGSELQGAAAGNIEPLGIDGDHLIISSKDRPLVHVIGVHNKDRFHQKCVLPGPVTAICSDKGGRLVFMSIRKQLYCWLMSTGELLSVIEAHYQNISRMALSDDDSILFTCSKDGAIHAYLVSDLISADRENTVEPIRKWTTHTLAVTDLKLTKGSNPRVLTCGMDHIACLSSISLDSTILKLSADRPLTCCAIDNAESRIFIGTDVGNIAQINLFNLGSDREILVQTNDEYNNQFSLLSGHSDEITQLEINTDASLLASGDSFGKYCIWEIASRQCLKVSNMRAAISTLRFIGNWMSIADAEHKPTCRPVWDLKRDATKLEKMAVEVATEFNVDQKMWENVVDETLQQLLRGSNINMNQKKKAKKMEEANVKKTNEEPEVVVLKEEDEDEGAPEFVKKLKQKKKNKKKKNNKSNTVNATSPGKPGGENLQNIVDELIKENERLKEINRGMYEFVAKEMASDATDDD